MAFSGSYFKTCVENEIILHSPLRNIGFVPESGSEVFVRNIPVEDNEEDLASFFEKIGAIFEIRLMVSKIENQNRGFGYVTYFNPSLAYDAVDILNNVLYKEKWFLRIILSLNNCRLFIGSIPISKRRHQIRQELNRNGITNIMNLIMYRSCSNRAAKYRGFVSVDFKTHEEAVCYWKKYKKKLRLWGHAVYVDWSAPIPEVIPAIKAYVKVLFLRNLDVAEAPEVFQLNLQRFVAKRYIEKTFKFKNYAFVHLQTREIAENLMKTLVEYYKETPVEVMWAKPPNKFTKQEYRQRKVNSLSTSLNSYKSARMRTICETQSTRNNNQSADLDNSFRFNDLDTSFRSTDLDNSFTFTDLDSSFRSADLDNSFSSSEGVQNIHPQPSLPWFPGLNNCEMPTAHSTPLVSPTVAHRTLPVLINPLPVHTYHPAVNHGLQGSTSYNHSSDLMHLLTQGIRPEIQHTSRSGIDVLGTANLSSELQHTPGIGMDVLGATSLRPKPQYSPARSRIDVLEAASLSMSSLSTIDGYVAPERSAYLQDRQQRCDLFDVQDDVATWCSPPGYSSLLKSTIPEGTDPIKNYQREMARVYGPRTEIFDKENIEREMAFMPRDMNFEDLQNYIGDILDNFRDVDRLE